MYKRGTHSLSPFCLFSSYYDENKQNGDNEWVLILLSNLLFLKTVLPYICPLYILKPKRGGIIDMRFVVLS